MPPAALLAPAPAIVDRAGLVRRQKIARSREERRSIAAMLAAAIALTALVAVNPFEAGRTAPSPSRQQIAGVPPASPPSRPTALTQPSPTREAPAMVSRPSAATAIPEPPDGYLSEQRRLARPRLTIEPPAAEAWGESVAAQLALLSPGPLPAPAQSGAAPAAGSQPMARSVSAPDRLAALTAPPKRSDEELPRPVTPPLTPPPSSWQSPFADPDPLREATVGLSFEQRLVHAAFELTKIPGGYDHRYVRIAYPMGDVPEGWGVCTDVLVRAYRGLGIDLQQLVHMSKLGTGDTNVDHRRVAVLIRFFAKYGESLTVSPFPESYKPGDIVAYDVPWGRTSKWHIAIVTGELSPSLRPMIVHNRGYGAKLEDALFHKRIIGHYRLNSANLTAMQARSLPNQPTATAAPAQRQRRALIRVSEPRS